MLIKTYNTNDDKNVVNKSLTNENEIDIKLKNDMEIIAPTIVLSGAIPTFNYVYIPTFNRYYFVVDTVKGNNDLYYISLKCDRLMSFKEQIKNSYGIITHCETLKNSYIPDSTYTIDARKTTHTVAFPNSFNSSPQFVLITSGVNI